MRLNSLTGYSGSLMFGRLILYDTVILPRGVCNCESRLRLKRKYINKLNVSLQIGLKSMLAKFQSKYSFLSRTQNYAKTG